MRLIESKAEYIPQEEGLEGIYKQIELAGRTAYKSEDKIVNVINIDIADLPDEITVKNIPNYKTNQQQCIEYLRNHKIKYQAISSAKDFVDRMIKSKHGAALEAGTVYLKIPVNYNKVYEGNSYAGGVRIDITSRCPYYEANPYSKSSIIHTNFDMGYPDIPYGYNFKGGIKYQIVTTNFRVLQENNWLDDLQYLCSPTEFHEKRYTMRFTCDRGVSHELVRHRTFSFLQESTRYCNYSKDKFDNELTFIIPRTPSAVPGRYTHDEEVLSDNLNVPYCKGSAGWLFYKTLLQIEKTYQALTSTPPVGEVQPIFTPQQARHVLPNALKTELIMTGFSSDWRFLMDLRLFEKTGKVHPDMKDLMRKAQRAMQKAGIWEDIMSKPSKFD